jgi:hypothetical protein
MKMTGRKLNGVKALKFQVEAMAHSLTERRESLRGLAMTMDKNGMKDIMKILEVWS